MDEVVRWNQDPLYSANQINHNCSYSGASEILEYFKNVAEKYDLMKYIRLNHRVISAIWDERQQKWNLKIQKGDDPNDIVEDTADIFVNASGVLKYLTLKPSPCASS